jgi:D-aminoacyl-tRNA deacylase
MMSLPSTSTILLVSSKYDPAGTLIHSCILESNSSSLFSHLIVSKRLVEIDTTFAKWIKEGITCVIFLSRHAGKGAVPTLTVHATGNYASAELGGKPKTLSRTDPHLMHAIFTELLVRVPEGYTVSYEVTHHGPTSVILPSFFVEIGSTEKEWRDTHAAQAVAESVIEVIKQKKHVHEKKASIPLIGFGGSHYAARQTEIASISRGACGHIMPTHQINHLTNEIFCQMVEMSLAEGVYIDKKSLKNKDISKIAQLATAHNLPILSQTELVNLQNTSFSVYRKALSLIPELFSNMNVAVHPHHIEEITNPVPLTISPDLVFEAQKVVQNSNSQNSHGTLLDAICHIPCIHFSGNGIAVLNTFIVDQAQVARRTDELIQACVRIIRTAYHCTYQDDVLIIHKQRFNLEKAQNFGIRPGPAYGKLMSGQSVLQDGCEIRPDMVMDNEEYAIVVSSGTHVEKYII